ncbi:Putative pyruvate carboxylase [Tenacibaculum dicentrarchi]|uniref:Pyruvate carboxylase n=1 Tax=Tenacibaculum dicentrarchi TaxID=669041 RepID=A0ABM9P041_9FLAO|nr:Putative pyruvate carboxylase [Tenacibaculum dicentrarchi]
MVLLISEEKDLTTNYVIDWLHSYSFYNFKIFNSNKFNIINSFEIGNSTNISFDDVNSLDIKKVWHRRAKINFRFTTTYNNLDEKLKIDEQVLLYFFENFLNTQVEYIGSYKKEVENNKLDVLVKAKKNGLNIPNTLITSSKKKLQEFYCKSKKIITKDLYHPVWFKIENTQYSSVGTILITQKMINQCSDFFIPMFLQEMIEKKYEIRVFMYKKTLYPMAIFSQNDKQTKVDYRNYNNTKPNRNVPIEITKELENKIFCLTKDLNLNTCSIDFIVTKSNEYVFLEVNPWERLRLLRKAMPNILLQMLIRGSNGVGYTAYSDNLIERFVAESWENGVDIFRIFDSLNWMKSIAPCIEHVRTKTNGLAEGSICYTGDILNPENTKYNLKYYTQLAKDIENAGAHILAIKDMAGLLKPYAAFELVSALKQKINIPIHLHTHDTSSIQSATYLKAIEAGVDVVDVALGGLSGLTSQPNFNSIVEMMKFNERESDLNIDSLNKYSNYWETVREYYYPFESGLKAGSGEVFKHEIPGGQYSNLKPQAQALGLEDRFYEITKMYGDVNHLFGDIVKVTPSSKVVGDMAQYLVSNNLTVQDVLERGDTISFPQSVVSFFRGDLGQPVGGFPKELQKLILKDEKPYTDRPNAHIKTLDFDKEYKDFKKIFEKDLSRPIDITDFLSYKLYPKVFTDAYNKRLKYDSLINLPTKNFFYGMEIDEEINVEIDKGKTLLITLDSVGKANQDGMVTVYFKVNGQGRSVQIKDTSIKIDKVIHAKADKNNSKEIGAPLQGMLSTILVKKGDKITKNQPLFIIEAMKMETTITATENTSIDEIILKAGNMVYADDLIIKLK